MQKHLLSLFEPEAVNTAATLYRSFTHLYVHSFNFHAIEIKLRNFHIDVRISLQSSYSILLLYQFRLVCPL